ncbi:hypothetical protein ACJ72_06309 [Emergomyces africanus]|uniref:mRNA cap guanine-N(7) methyltransferase n=1 Tax=Emergomyces africanus TaxID=1955775 RepID=A0A1B7NRF3_9EURO|nr:hypothetical protein ACJ72_06309 [Emergomyces africanus]
MATSSTVDRRRASITMYDPARDSYTVADDGPPLDNATKHSIKVHELAQAEQATDDGVLLSRSSTPVHNNEKKSSLCESLEETQAIHSTPLKTIDGGWSGSKPERSFSSPQHDNHSNLAEPQRSSTLLSSHPTHHNKRPLSATPSVPMGSSSDIAHDELPSNDQPLPQSPNVAHNGYTESPEGRQKIKAGNNEKKKKLPENEPQPEKTEPAPEQRSKRKRQEESSLKHKKRGKVAPSAYSLRDRSPTPPRRSRSPDFRRRGLQIRRSRSPSPIRRSPSPESSVPRQRKRPGGAARIGSANLEALKRRQEERERQREEEAKLALRERGVHDVVRQHYNAVPERGREWRKTDSRIKGLRSFNNWIKSTVIQKFSPDEEFLARANGKTWAGAEPVEEKKLLVIDVGCGKGGDLGKWQQAPQPVDLYVGLDPAEISIEQARERYSSMKSGKGRMGRRGNPLFHAEFYPKDCFGEWVGDIPIIQQVGIDGSVGPGGSMMAARWGGGGFDIVVSMFSMHYAFESEVKARQMLHNVAGLLKKGGRFIGVGPNSDVLSAKVVEFHEKKKIQEAAAAAAAARLGDDGEREDGEVEESPMTVPEWGNSIYRVRFPGETPEDGVFRPAFGWKYSYFMEEAVEEIPEYVVPWEAFRALTQDYNLELQYRKPFLDIWKEEKDDPILGPLSERMGVRARGGGPILVNDEELEAATQLTQRFYSITSIHTLINPQNQETMSTTRPFRTRPDTTPQQPRGGATRRSDAQGGSNRREGQGQQNHGTLLHEPPYQPQVAPFNASTIPKLSQLPKFPRLAALQTRLTTAAEALTECAGMINDRLADAKAREARRAGLKRKAADVDGEGEVEGEVEGAAGEDEQRSSKIVAMEERVKTLTGQLEEGMRKIVDAEVRTISLTDGLVRIHKEAVAAVAAVPQVNRRRMRRRPGEESGDEEEGGDEGGEQQPSTEEPFQIQDGGTCKALQKGLKEKKDQWKEMSLTDR